MGNLILYTVFLQGHGVMLNSHHSWPFRHHFSSKFWNIDQNQSEPIRNCFPSIFMIPEASREHPFMISRHLEKSVFFSIFSCVIMAFRDRLISMNFNLFQWLSIHFIILKCFCIFLCWSVHSDGEEESASHPTLTVVREPQRFSLIKLVSIYLFWTKWCEALSSIFPPGGPFGQNQGVLPWRFFFVFKPIL